MEDDATLAGAVRVALQREGYLPRIDGLATLLVPLAMLDAALLRELERAARLVTRAGRQQGG